MHNIYISIIRQINIFLILPFIPETSPEKSDKESLKLVIFCCEQFDTPESLKI